VGGSVTGTPVGAGDKGTTVPGTGVGAGDKGTTVVPPSEGVPVGASVPDAGDGLSLGGEVGATPGVGTVDRRVMGE
jgi:hypothetical protein